MQAPASSSVHLQRNVLIPKSNALNSLDERNSMPKGATLRKLAGSLFLLGNLNLLFWNLSGANGFQLVGSIFMSTCSVGIALSSRNPRWLLVSGTALMTGQSLVGISAQGAGAWLTRLGVVPPVLQGALLFRAGWQSVSGKRFEAKNIFQRPLELIDRYPLAAAGAIEAPGTAAIAIGAFLSRDLDLALSATLWTVANVSLFFSDSTLRARLGLGV